MARRGIHAGRFVTHRPMRPQRPRRAGVMWLKNAHSEVGCGIRRVFAIRSRPRRHLCTELCTGSVDNAVPLRRRPPRQSGTESAVTSSQRLWDTFCAPGSPRPCFPTTKLVLMTEGHRHVSESEEEAPGEESLATAKLRADVARQQMRLAKDQLKRARKRFKEARREARRARKLAAMARRAWKRQKRRRKGGDDARRPATAGRPSSVALRARARTARRAAAKRGGKAGRKSARSTVRRRGRGKRSRAASATRKRR